MFTIESLQERAKEHNVDDGDDLTLSKEEAMKAATEAGLSEEKAEEIWTKNFGDQEKVDTETFKEKNFGGDLFVAVLSQDPDDLISKILKGLGK